MGVRKFRSWNDLLLAREEEERRPGSPAVGRPGHGGTQNRG